MLQVPLRLPFVAHKFMVGSAELGKEAFFSKWKSYTGDWLGWSWLVGLGVVVWVLDRLSLKQG